MRFRLRDSLEWIPVDPVSWTIAFVWLARAAFPLMIDAARHSDAVSVDERLVVVSYKGARLFLQSLTAYNAVCVPLSIAWKSLTGGAMCTVSWEVHCVDRGGHHVINRTPSDRLGQ